MRPIAKPVLVCLCWYAWINTTSILQHRNNDLSYHKDESRAHRTRVSVIHREISSSSNELALPRKQITPFNRVFQVIVCGVSRLTNSPSIKRVSDTNTFSRHKKSSMNVCRHQQSGYIVCLTV